MGIADRRRGQWISRCDSQLVDIHVHALSTIWMSLETNGRKDAMGLTRSNSLTEDCGISQEVPCDRSDKKNTLEKGGPCGTDLAEN